MTALLTMKQKLEAFERELILEALEANDCAIGRSAVALGITRKNLWEKMLRYKLRTVRLTSQTVIYDGDQAVVTLKVERVNRVGDRT